MSKEIVWLFITQMGCARRRWKVSQDFERLFWERQTLTWWEDREVAEVLQTRLGVGNDAHKGFALTESRPRDNFATLIGSRSRIGVSLSFASSARRKLDEERRDIQKQARGTEFNYVLEKRRRKKGREGGSRPCRNNRGHFPYRVRLFDPPVMRYRLSK